MLSEGFGTSSGGGKFLCLMYVKAGLEKNIYRAVSPIFLEWWFLIWYLYLLFVFLKWLASFLNWCLAKELCVNNGFGLPRGCVSRKWLNHYLVLYIPIWLCCWYATSAHLKGSTIIPPRMSWHVWCLHELGGWEDEATYVNPIWIILPKTNSSHLKMDGWNTTFLLGWSISRCYVSFREGKSESRLLLPTMKERTKNMYKNCIPGHGNQWKSSSNSFIFGTQMTLVFYWNFGLVLEGWSPKIEDKQVPGKRLQ